MAANFMFTIEYKENLKGMGIKNNYNHHITNNNLNKCFFHMYNIINNFNGTQTTLRILPHNPIRYQKVCENKNKNHAVK
jgi:hypothetical protein